MVQHEIELKTGKSRYQIKIEEDKKREVDRKNREAERLRGRSFCDIMRLGPRLSEEKYSWKKEF